MEYQAQSPLNTPGKRPRFMTFMLILSLINACWKILSSIVSYFVIPVVARMMETGELRQNYEPLFGMMGWGEEEIVVFMDTLQSSLNINVNYHLIIALLFVGSLVGVIMMFKLDKRGLHTYAISQILILIAASVFLYPNQAQSSFFPDLLLTLLFILWYHLFFKRIEILQKLGHDQDPQI